MINTCECGSHAWQILSGLWVALVDAEDAVHFLPKTIISRAPNLIYAMKPKSVLLHREIMDAKKGEIVDHINHNGLDNRKSNLRLCTHMQNMQNSRKHKPGQAGFKGVEFTPGSKIRPFRARIKANKERFYVGRFATAEEAARAYDAAIVILHGDFAVTNKSLGLL